MDESASWLVTTLPSLAAIHIAIINFLICQVTSCGHVFKGACNFKAPHHKSQPAMFGVARGIVLLEIVLLTLSVFHVATTKTKVQSAENFLLKNSRKEMMKAK